MQFGIFFIGQSNDKTKCNHKNERKNKLTGGKHNFVGLAQINKKMQEKIDAVAKFHKAFGLGILNEPQADLGKDKNLLRYKLMREENEEYLEAAENGDLIEVADALGDMLYILCGTILEHGMQHKIEEVFNEIQRSNMSKAWCRWQPNLSRRW